MGAFVDLTGCVFGELTVKARAENKGKETMWLCECSCGNTKIVSGGNLRNGYTKSCGCRQYAGIKAYNEDKALKLEGKRFGRLLVTSRHKSSRKGRTMWDCICDCGNTCVACGRDLVQGDTRSCGCLHDELLMRRVVKHGLSRVGKRDPRYLRLYTINTRCYNPKHPRYKDYGGRGIKVCFEWNVYENPRALENWLRFCDETGYREGLTIERKDVEGDYTPTNCLWIPLREQYFNTRRTVRLSNGRPLIQVCIELGFFEKSADDMKLYRRITNHYRRYGTLPKEVVDAAIRQNKRHLLEGVKHVERN